MEKSMLENSSKRKRVITELVQGREFATKLQILLRNPFRDDCSVSAQQLVMKIFRSFNDTLSVLSSDHGSAGDSQIPASAQVGSSCSGDRVSQDSGESRKLPAVMDRRGRYKRRKNSEARITISPIIEDGYAWRKYGQKVILNDKYPRCYFRCTHKYDHNCRALKQVQQIEEEDNNIIMYHITYFGYHTCRGTKKSPESNLEKESMKSYMVNFESNKTPISKQSSHHPSLKEETNSSLDSFLWKDLIALEPSHHEEDVLSSVHSCASTSSIGLDIGDFIRCVDFDSDFKFDEIEFF